jgi:predicted MFS family arabinose efflux permease
MTEAYTWTATGFGGGIALGSAAGGWLVEHSGTAASFSVAAVCIAVAAAIAYAGRDTLRHERRAPQLAPQPA